MRNFVYRAPLALAAGLATFASYAAPPPAAPTDPAHPGSKVYNRGFTQRSLTCEGRAVDLYLPALEGDDRAALVVFGHGQALAANVYKATFEHLAKKGIAVAFPAFDRGFFDQDWQRMGRDFVTQADCALAAVPALDPARVVYAGHSKGAYVASIAAGLARGMNASSVPGAVLLFEPAGYDSASLRTIPPETALTVVFAERDTIVSRDISEAIFAQAGSRLRQFVFLKNYRSEPALVADHMWPLNERTAFGGGPEGAFHYYGSWKWLVAAANDLASAERFRHPYLYGALAVDKGAPGEADEIRRSW